MLSIMALVAATIVLAVTRVRDELERPPSPEAVRREIATDNARNLRVHALKETIR